MPDTKRWVVTTSGDRSLRDVEKNLVEAGFTVDEVFDEIGVINGTADEEVAEQLRAIPTVVDVSPEDVIDIGPPDKPVSW
jgi:hypothetical protein